MRPVEIVHPLVAGEVRIKRAQIEGRWPIPLRQWRTMLSREWTSELPIYCWVIDHPDGTILVDTGPKRTGEWWYPRHHVYYPLAYRTRVGPDQGLERGLDDLGMDTTDLDAIVLTHAHPDHGEGLRRLRDVPTYVNEAEQAYAGTLRGRFWGAHPSCRPSRQQARPVAYPDGPVGPFDRSFELPEAPGVSIVPTPGHTPHHSSVAVEGDGPTVFLAADACLSLDQLETGRPDGVSIELAAARETLRSIDTWRRDDDVIVLPSHDSRGADALRNAL